MKTFLLPCLLVIASCASSSAEDAGFEAMLMGKAPKSNLSAKEAAQVEASPLGSAKNPIRAEGPAGQRAYLMRLRCPEGRAPMFERGGSVGIGPYGSMLDVYEVTCDAPPVHSIYMDLYHPGFVEARPVAGFTIEAAGGT